jgi:hypothetical protein
LEVLNSPVCSSVTSACVVTNHVEIQASPADPHVGESVDLDTSNSTLNYPRSEVRWEYNGDGDFTTSGGADVSATFTPQQRGSQQIGVRITTTDGTTTTGFVTLNVRAAPGTDSSSPVATGRGSRRPMSATGTTGTGDPCASATTTGPSAQPSSSTTASVAARPHVPGGSAAPRCLVSLLRVLRQRGGTTVTATISDGMLRNAGGRSFLVEVQRHAVKRWVMVAQFTIRAGARIAWRHRYPGRDPRAQASYRLYTRSSVSTR